MAQEKITSAYQEIGVEIGTGAVPLIYGERSKEDANDNEPQVGIQKVDYEVDEECEADEEYEADEEADEEIDEVDLSDGSEDDELALLDPDEVDLGGFEDIDGDDPMDKDTEETSDDDEPVNSRRTRGKKVCTTTQNNEYNKIKIIR